MWNGHSNDQNDEDYHELCKGGHQRPQCGMVTPIMLMLITIEVDNDDKGGSYDSIIMVAGREDMDYNKLHEMKSCPRIFLWWG